MVIILHHIEVHFYLKLNVSNELVFKLKVLEGNAYLTPHLIANGNQLQALGVRELGALQQALLDAATHLLCLIPQAAGVGVMEVELGSRQRPGLRGAVRAGHLGAAPVVRQLQGGQCVWLRQMRTCKLIIPRDPAGPDQLISSP